MAAEKTQTPISETLFHETDSFLPIMVDLWLSVAGKVPGRLEERAPHFKLAMKKFKVDHPDYFESKPPCTTGVIHRDECYEVFAKRHPRVWANVIS